MIKATQSLSNQANQRFAPNGAPLDVASFKHVIFCILNICPFSLTDAENFENFRKFDLTTLSMRNYANSMSTKNI